MGTDGHTDKEKGIENLIGAVLQLFVEKCFKKSKD
jgi:hypothetical protein